MTVRILVDSTADIPPARARELGIEVVPLTVHFGDDGYRDGVDIDGPTFYHRLTTSQQTPSTSTPPPALFEERFRALIAQGATGIFAIHIASALSGSYSVSSLAAKEVTAATGVPIAVLDSHTVSAGFGVTAEIVAREARAGATLDQLQARAADLLSRTHLLAVLDTLEYLQRGGRIGKARALIGTMLSVKPLLEVRDSQVLPIANVRTRSRAQERIGEMIARLGELEIVAIAASDPTIGGQLKTVTSSFWQGPVEMYSLGPVIGAHAGPGAGAIVAVTRASPSR